MNLLLWNVEWATTRSRRGTAIRGIIADLQPDLICMTEGTAAMLPDAGHTIEASADYGYGATGERRKVLLWSLARDYQGAMRRRDRRTCRCELTRSLSASSTSPGGNTLIATPRAKAEHAPLGVCTQ